MMTHSFLKARAVCMLALGLAVIAAPSAQARKVAYETFHGEWKVIEEGSWPRHPNKAAGTEPVRTAGVSFDVTYLDVVNNNNIGFDDPTQGTARRNVLNAVFAYIGAQIQSAVILEVEVQPSFTNGGADGPTLASAGTLFFTGPPGFQRGFSLEHVVTGIDPGTFDPDITVTVDFGFNWNSTLDPPAPGEQDLFSVLLHELTHGLAFVSLTDQNGNSEIGTRVFSFLDNEFYTGNGTKIWNASGFLQVPANAFTGGQNGVFYRGTNGVQVFGGFIPIFAPGVYLDGSSISHWDTSISPIPVMNPSFAAGTQRREWLRFEKAALADLGYVIDFSGNAARHWEVLQ